MAKKQFKAESKRLLDLMINSIYTNRDIFLRELISNASDATDKLYYNAMQEGQTGMNREDLPITIAVDKEKRMIAISDKGCGMTREELENNLGTIAKSGSLAFKKDNEKKEDIDIIGQFGVGFYSAFMVAKKVEVYSRSVHETGGFCWESEGADGYTVKPCEMAEHGTRVVMHLKDNTEDESFDVYLDQFKLSSLVKKYSDYIRYPIQMDMERRRPKADNDKEFEFYTETETLNSMIPIWKKRKSELKQEDYNQFYKDKFGDFTDPLKVIHTSTEGAATYHALLFIPGQAPYNFYTRDYEKGLQLYSNGVLIMDKCGDLLPDHFSFVKGVVDSADLSLNISREMLQHDRQLKIIAGSLEKKIKSELSQMLKNERDTYETFFQAFGLQLKYGIYSSFGGKKDELQDLLLFASSFSDKWTTLPEYAARMKEEQKEIYYACGENLQKASGMPQAELVKNKGYEILYMTDEVDEFVLKILATYEGKQFKNIADSDLDLETEAEKQEVSKKAEDKKDILAGIKEALGDKVKEVKLTSRLASHPVCLSSGGSLSLDMEKVLRTVPGQEMFKAERILEINAKHPIFDTLCRLFEEDREKFETYAQILYNNALIIEGMPMDDPVAFSNAVCNLLAR